MSESTPTDRPQFDWQQTMLRIKDPKITIPFYETHFGFRTIHTYHFEEWNFSLYFMAIFPEGMAYPEPNTKESEQLLWNLPRGVATLELTHNHGTETDESFVANNGNVEPYRGFGHIAVMTKDVYAASAELEANGVLFKKRPDEGRMKGLAFALDPDGYWIEIVRRDAECDIALPFTLAQTMIRVKDPEASLKFYRDILGMNLVRSSDMSDFSLYFLSHAPPDSVDRMVYEPVIELTWNHGTEKDPDFHYHNGNDTDKGQARGYGHVGFVVDDLDAACAYLDTNGVTFKKRPSEGGMRGLAFVYDPDGYWVEIIQRGGPSV